MEELRFSVSNEAKGERVDKYLAGRMPDKTRSFIQKLIKEEGVTANGNVLKANYKLCAGDELLVSVPTAGEPDIIPEDIPLSILYEDDDVLVVDKPKGMVVHPAPGHYSGTLVNAVLYHCKGRLSGINGIMRPGIVHRIDMDTTGSLLICKNDLAHQKMAVQLKEHSITRKYHAIVHGILKDGEGTISLPIGRHPVDRKKMSTHAVNVGDGKDTPDTCTHGQHRPSRSRRRSLRPCKVSVQTTGADSACQNSWNRASFNGEIHGI